MSTICELPGNLRGASWGDDGTIVFGVTGPSGLWRVAAAGGEPELLTRPEAGQGETDYRWPEILPGGEAVLFTISATLTSGGLAGATVDSRIVVRSLDTGEQRVLIQGGAYPRYSPTGHLVYAMQGTVWAVRFDPSRLETAGEPVPVQEEVLTKRNGAANFSLSKDGSLIYMPGVAATPPMRTMVWVDRDGREETLGAPPAPYESPRISPDGGHIVVEVQDPDNRDVFLYDLTRQAPSRLTLDPGVDGYPVWTPDGKTVVFGSDRAGPFNLFSKAADGTGQSERVATSDSLQWPEAWSADGRTLIVGDNPGGQFDIHILVPGEEDRTAGLLFTPFTEVNSQISPDGRWISYQSNESGRFEVYVRPFPNVDDGRWQISRDGGQSPVWSPDGGEMFFRRGGSWEMMAVSVESEPSFSAGNPEVLFDAPYLVSSASLGRTRTWDVAQDGRFLMVKENATRDGASTSSHIVVVQDWFEELKRLVPTH